MKHIKQILPLVVVILMVAAAHAFRKPVGNVVEDNIDVLQELSTVLHKMDTVTMLTIEGTITAKDLADSTRNMVTPFCYSRDGQQAYYRIGAQEMIALRDAYIVVAHDLHKVFVSAPRTILPPMQLPAGKEASLLAEEGYAIARHADEDGVHISLLNRMHPTCRSYDITFDSTGWIKQTYMRVADEGNPEDTTIDKFIGVHMQRCEPGVVRRDLLNPAYVQSLTGYEIITER